jgi:hypothetical protein
MAALVLIVLLVSSLASCLLQPLLHLSGAVLSATWLVWLPLVAGVWLLLAEDPAGGGKH